MVAACQKLFLYLTISPLVYLVLGFQGMTLLSLSMNPWALSVPFHSVVTVADSLMRFCRSAVMVL